MSQIYFFSLWLLVISLTSQRFVFATAVGQSPSIVPLDRPTEGITLHIGPLALTELGSFAGKTHWIGNSRSSQSTVRTECISAGLDLLSFTAGLDEYNFIQSALNRNSIYTNVWTDYINFIDHDCFRSHGEVVPHALTITPANSTVYQIGLATAWTGGLHMIHDPAVLHYICSGPTPPPTTTTEVTVLPTTADPGNNSTTPGPGNGFCEGIPTTCSLEDDCTGSGCCRSKWFCVRDDSPLGPDYDNHRVVTGVCERDPDSGEQLFFNPDSSNFFGGKCDRYRNLPESVKDRYRADRDCIDQCECHPVSKCSSEYTCYKNGKTTRLSCGPGEGFDRFEGCTSMCK